MSLCRLYLLLLFVAFSQSGTLVLKNKKQVRTAGPYIVEGNFVVYFDAKGEKFKLPLAIVDLDQSSTEDPEPTQEELDKAAAAKKKPASSMDKIHEYVGEHSSDADRERRKSSFNNEDAAVSQYDRFKKKTDAFGEKFTTAMVYELLYRNDMANLAVWLRTKPDLNDVDFIDANYETPLIYALRLSNLKGVEMLLEAGANPNMVGRYFTPMFAAILPAHSADVAFVNALLKYRADPNTTGPEGLSPAAAAISGRNLPIFKALADYGARMDFVHPKYGSILELALAMPDPGYLKVIFDQSSTKVFKALPGGGSFSDFLIIAGNHVNLPVVLDHYEKHKIPHDPLQMFHLAIAHNQGRVIETLLNRYPLPSKQMDELVISAVHSGNAECLEELLKRKANPNAVDAHGEAALILAARKGVLSLVKCLVNNGASLTCKSNKGYTATAEAQGTDRELIRSYLRSQ